MTIDSTYRPEITEGGVQNMPNRELQRDIDSNQQVEYQQRQRQAEGVPCPVCGTVNDSEAIFCASCGQPLRKGACPNCGSEMDPDADFCEVCHHYVKTNVCSFCGAQMSENEVYCHECGNPKGGVVCPVCHTLNDFAFCKQCGTPLTDEAKVMVEELKMQPDYQLLVNTAKELEELNMQLPYASERDALRDQANDKLRERVLMLLAQDQGIPNPVIPKVEAKRMSKEELDKEKKRRTETITEILDRMATPMMPSPVKARNYAMAQKPAGVKLAWVCNWKHAMHSSPCGCAKPHLGGKWVILGKNNKQEIKDDK